MTLRTSIQNLFDTKWEKKELVLASCLLPCFKLLWLDSPKRIMANAWLRFHFENMDYTSNSEARETETPICLASTYSYI